MKNEKGFTLIELSISIVAFVLFAIIVGNLNYAIFSNSMYAKQNALLTEKSVEILELVGTMNIESDFDEYGNLVENSSIYLKIENNNKFNSFEKIENRITFKDEKYDYVVDFKDYTAEEGNEGAQINILKIVKVTVKHNEEKIEIQRLLTLK